MIDASRRIGLYTLIAFALAGCATGGVLDKSFEMVGLKRPEPSPEVKAAMLKLRAQREVALRVHAGQKLNVDTDGHALSLVIRIYKLRSTAEFTQATYAMFDATAEGRPAFDAEVLSVREVVLKPGQRYEVVETMPAEATHLAVTGMFRAPDMRRWRFVFETLAAAASGVTLGAHACALSVAQGAPIGVPPEALRLAGAQCR